MKSTQTLQSKLGNYAYEIDLPNLYQFEARYFQVSLMHSNVLFVKEYNCKPKSKHPKQGRNHHHHHHHSGRKSHGYNNSIDTMNNSNSSNGGNSNNSENGTVKQYMVFKFGRANRHGPIYGVCIENNRFPKQQPWHCKYIMTRNELLKFFAKIIQKNKRSTNANKNRFSKQFSKHQRLQTPRTPQTPSLQSIQSLQSSLQSLQSTRSYPGVGVSYQYGLGSVSMSNLGSMMRDSTPNASPSPRPRCGSVTSSVSNASVAFQCQNPSPMRLQLTQFSGAGCGSSNIGNISNQLSGNGISNHNGNGSNINSISNISNMNNNNNNGVLTTETDTTSNCSYGSPRSGPSTSTRSPSPPSSLSSSGGTICTRSSSANSSALSSLPQLTYANLSEMNSYHAYLTGGFNHVNSLGGLNNNMNNSLNCISGLNNNNNNGIYRASFTNGKSSSHGKSKASRINYGFGSGNNGSGNNGSGSGSGNGKSGVEWIEKQLLAMQQRIPVISKEYNGEYDYRSNVAVILFKLKQGFRRYDKPESCTLDDVVFDNNGNLLDRSKSLNKFEYLHYLSKYLRMSREDLLCKSIVDAFKFVKRFPNTALTQTYIDETHGRITFELIILAELEHSGHYFRFGIPVCLIENGKCEFCSATNGNNGSNNIINNGIISSSSGNNSGSRSTRSSIISGSGSPTHCIHSIHDNNTYGLGQNSEISYYTAQNILTANMVANNVRLNSRGGVLARNTWVDDKFINDDGVSFYNHFDPSWHARNKQIFHRSVAVSNSHSYSQSQSSSQSSSQSHSSSSNVSPKWNQSISNNNNNKNSRSHNHSHSHTMSQNKSNNISSRVMSECGFDKWRCNLDTVSSIHSGRSIRGDFAVSSHKSSMNMFDN